MSIAPTVEGTDVAIDDFSVRSNEAQHGGSDETRSYTF